MEMCAFSASLMVIPEQLMSPAHVTSRVVPGAEFMTYDSQLTLAVQRTAQFPFVGHSMTEPLHPAEPQLTVQSSLFWQEIGLVLQSGF